jgi:hyperosmotically inducible protein
MKFKSLFLMLTICGALIGNTYAASSNNDATLNDSVKSGFQNDPALSNVDVVVVTKKGVVIIKGQVNSDTEANALVEHAQAVPGVHDVDASGLTVKESKQPMTDSYTTAKVKGAFLREKLFGDKPIEPMSISVETKDGVVYLSGAVENKKIIGNAVKIAKSVKGVKSVNSKLTVEVKQTSED